MSNCLAPHLYVARADRIGRDLKAMISYDSGVKTRIPTYPDENL
jgi:hypothetical protein